MKCIKLKKIKNTTNQKKYVKNLISRQEPCSIGATMGVSNSLEQTLDIEDIFYQTQIQRIFLHEEKYVIVEFQHQVKKKIWIDKLSSSDLNILTMKLLKTLDQESTLKEKGLTPFWNQQSKEMSKRLWLPTEIDCVDSVLTSSKKSLREPMGRSWFSIKKKHPLNKNSLAISFQSSQFSLPDSTVSGVTISNVKSKKVKIKSTTLGVSKKQKQSYKTMKFRLFPTDEEKKHIDLYMDQQRWYYNAAINILYKNKGINRFTTILKSGKEKINISRDKIRDYMRKFDFTETIKDDKIYKNFIYNEDKNSFPVPEWWKSKKPNSRVIRGAFDKLASNIESAISNKANGNIKEYNMSFRTKKKSKEFIRFEDTAIPKEIKSVKSHYWYRTKDKKRNKRKIYTMEELYKTDNKCSGIEYVKDNITGIYYLHCPVDIDFFPEGDIRSDNQAKYKTEGDRVISLDPGVRKFLVGYDPSGSMVFIGENDHKILIGMLLDIDKETDKTLLYLKWKKVKNYVDELHWKTISFLIENYDNIIIPEFRIQSMIKSRKISKMTKRLMVMYSFHKFKERLLWKCKTFNKSFILVTEEYTSKTCTGCGTISDVGGSEVYNCKSCKLKIDRDVNGARNIFIKNVIVSIPPLIRCKRHPLGVN